MQNSFFFIEQKVSSTLKKTVSPKKVIFSGFHFSKIINGIFCSPILGIVTKKSWDWLTKDVDPIPGTKEFAKEYRETQSKLERLNKKYEKHRQHKK